MNIIAGIISDERYEWSFLIIGSGQFHNSMGVKIDVGDGLLAGLATSEGGNNRSILYLSRTNFRFPRPPITIILKIEKPQH